MKKNIFYISALAVALCFGGTTFTSCSDPGDVQDLTLARVLSPTGLTARVTNQTDIIVTWNEMSGASNYEIEAYADNNDYANNTPVRKDITFETSYTLQGLMGETDYYIRVRALDKDNESRASKWVEVKKTTNPEQNMNKIKAGDIQSKSVKITWAPGIEVDKLIFTPTAAGSTAMEVTWPLDADEIAAGAATVASEDGPLEPETAYKVTLKLGEKTRGYGNFTTNMDFSDAVQVGPEDDWVAAITSAASGSKIALAPGTYASDEALVISNSVKIGAQSSADLPVIKTNIQVTSGASLMLYQIVLDGTDNANSAIDYKEAGNYGELTLKGCEIRNFVSKSFIYANVSALVSNVTIDNCLVHHVDTENGQDFLDFRKGAWDELSITNSTFYECAPKRDILRCDDNSATLPAAKMQTYISKCTFYNVGNGGSSHRFFYLRFKGNSNTFSYNIVANFINKRGFANSSAVGAPAYSKNYYYQCKNLMSQDTENTETGLVCFDTSGTALGENPFVNPDGGDFTLNDEILASELVGDPRWY